MPLFHFILLCCVCSAVLRVQVRDREIKVNIFDMAGHPFFYEVSHKRFYLHKIQPVSEVSFESIAMWGTCQQVVLLNQQTLFHLHLLFFSLLISARQVRNEFYKDSQGVLLVYDVGLRESFDALDSWLGEMKQEMGSQANMDSIVFVVCANKVRPALSQRAPSARRLCVEAAEGSVAADAHKFKLSLALNVSVY